MPYIVLVGKSGRHNQTAKVQLRKYPKAFSLVFLFSDNLFEMLLHWPLFLQDVLHVEKPLQYVKTYAYVLLWSDESMTAKCDDSISYGSIVISKVTMQTTKKKSSFDPSAKYQRTSTWLEYLRDMPPDSEFIRQLSTFSSYIFWYSLFGKILYNI